MSSHPRSARLEHVFVLTTLALLGCHGGGTKRPSDATLETQRTSCAFAPGAKPSETIGGDFPIGDAIPIDHFFIFMQENRSFDHYFGTMPGVDGLPANASNPDRSGTPVAAYHETEYCITDVEHGWDGTHVEWNDGANDGFVVANDPNGTRAMGYFDATDLPYYHALYSTFAMSQRHFCSLLGPTWVNRMYMVAGTSFGLVDNIAVPDDRLASYRGCTTLYEQLDAAGVEWRVYAGDAPTIIGLFAATVSATSTRIRTIDMLAADLASGDVAAVTFVEPVLPRLGEGSTQNDEHPPTNPQKGQACHRGAARRDHAQQRLADSPRSSSRTTSTAASTTTCRRRPSCVPDDFQAVYADLSPVDELHVRSLRLPRAARRRLTVREASLRLEPRHGSHEHPAPRAGPLRSARRSPTAMRTPGRCSTCSTSRTRTRASPRCRRRRSTRRTTRRARRRSPEPSRGRDEPRNRLTQPRASVVGDDVAVRHHERLERKLEDARRARRERDAVLRRDAPCAALRETPVASDESENDVRHEATWLAHVEDEVGDDQRARGPMVESDLSEGGSAFERNRHEIVAQLRWASRR